MVNIIKTKAQGILIFILILLAMAIPCGSLTFGLIKLFDFIKDHVHGTAYLLLSISVVLFFSSAFGIFLHRCDVRNERRRREREQCDHR